MMAEEKRVCEVYLLEGFFEGGKVKGMGKVT
jgi:hypothetical protein